MKRLDRAGLSVASQLREIDSIRGSIENAIADAPKGVGAALKSFTNDITAGFRQLSARQLTDRLFGDVFADLEKELQSLTPMGRATREYVDGTNRATSALAKFAGQLETMTSMMPGPANDNAIAGMRRGYSSMYGGFPINVAGAAGRPAGAAMALPTGLSAADLYQTTFTRLFERYLGKGAPLARDLGSIMQGYLQAGPLGGGLAGLSALIGSDSGIGRMVQSLSKAAPEIAMALEANKAISSLLGNDEIKNGKTLGVISPFLTRIRANGLSDGTFAFAVDHGRAPEEKIVRGGIKQPRSSTRVVVKMPVAGL